MARSSLHSSDNPVNLNCDAGMPMDNLMIISFNVISHSMTNFLQNVLNLPLLNSIKILFIYRNKKSKHFGRLLSAKYCLLENMFMLLMNAVGILGLYSLTGSNAIYINYLLSSIDTHRTRKIFNTLLIDFSAL